MARVSLVLLSLWALVPSQAQGSPPYSSVQLSAGFSSDAVLQRDHNVSVYGFASGANPPSIFVSVVGKDEAGSEVSYRVFAQVVRWDDSGFYPATTAPPPHGPWVWRAVLWAAKAGGEYTITASDGTANGSTSMERVTFGDVWFCSGQSNMALMTYFTFSADQLRDEVKHGKYRNVRHFIFGGMGKHYEATTPQWVTTQNSIAGDASYRWYNLTYSTSQPWHPDPKSPGLTPFGNFASTCMYFGVELVDAMSAQGLGSTPIGLISSSIGGSQIEAWMSNDTLKRCKKESREGGAIPQNSGALYYGMVAPFVNYSVRGWVWYQGENNVHGEMGNSMTGEGYGCELPEMVNSWRAVWDVKPDALFGVATLAAGTSEGSGFNMAAMRWSQTANYGVWPNPALPYSFGAQVYDLMEPWFYVGDGNRVDHGELQCCFGPSPECGGKGQPHPCTDRLNCSLPDFSTGRYGSNCSAWDSSLWSPAMKRFESLVRANSPGGIPGNSFMGPIHPRLKRPVGQRLAYAAVAQMTGKKGKGASTGPTISGCSYEAGKLELFFNLSLLGGEGLMLRPFNANHSSWAPESWWKQKSTTPSDSLGTMVCTANASEPEKGNATTCHCQGWNFYLYMVGSHNQTFWYCEVGPGYKPPAEVLAAERTRRAGLASAASLGDPHASALLKALPTGVNPFYAQWRPAPLKAASASSVVVDTSSFGGLEPLAVRLAWALFEVPHVPGDTCCPGADVQSGRAPCVPGNCPLYSSTSELPANPFFAKIVAGKCKCTPPQECGATSPDGLEPEPEPELLSI